LNFNKFNWADGLGWTSNEFQHSSKPRRYMPFQTTDRTVTMNNEFEYLCKRAWLFFDFLDMNKIDKIFPYKEESKKELKSKIATGSLQKIRNFNNLLDNLIIGKQDGFETTEKLELLKFFEENQVGNQTEFIQKKRSHFTSIIKNGFIKSRLEINDAIEIANSEILRLTTEEKKTLLEIIYKSAASRI
jgi:hypothetical protein